MIEELDQPVTGSHWQERFIFGKLYAIKFQEIIVEYEVFIKILVHVFPPNHNY